MGNDNRIDESRNYLRLALEHIGKHGLPTDRICYSVWYEYASGRNRELNAAIDKHLESGGSISEKVIRQLFDQFVADNKETLSKLVRNELKKVFAKIIGAIKVSHQAVSDSENNLDKINEALVPDLPEADVEKIVAQIKQEIHVIEASNTSFKQQIEQANSEIEHLRKKMERYRSEALKDPLTRIENRRGFDRHFLQAIEKSNALSTHLSLIIADIDHFKKVNDTHGHLVGDNVLRMVAATINDYIKGKDTAARVGGEEFAILLPDTPLEGAVKLANDIRIAFEKTDLKKKSTGESLGKITISFGATSYKHTEKPKDFADRADKALYKSKKNGRNRVTGI